MRVEVDASWDEALVAATPAGNGSTHDDESRTSDASKAVPLCPASFCMKNNYIEGLAEPSPYEGNATAEWISFSPGKTFRLSLC